MSFSTFARYVLLDQPTSLIFLHETISHLYGNAHLTRELGAMCHGEHELALLFGGRSVRHRSGPQLFLLTLVLLGLLGLLPLFLYFQHHSTS